MKMPLLIVCGFPCSGKSYLSEKINDYFKNWKNTVVVSDEVKINENQRNDLYTSAAKEKQLRGWIKSEAERHLNNDTLVIVDAANYIKGYRYELYCMSKERKTTHCVVESAASSETAWKTNQERTDSDRRYGKEVFDALVQRFESPDSRNRWDSPLLVVHFGEEIPFDQLEEALYKRRAPKPNLSTQTPPSTEASFLYILDSKTQHIVKLVLAAIHMGQFQNIKIPGSSETVSLSRILSQGELNRLRRQFLNYIKMHPETDTNNIETIFVQFINKSNQ